MDTLDEPNPHQSQVDFDALLRQHLQKTFRHFARSLWLGITQNATTHPHRKLDRYSANLAWITEISLATLGGKLKHNEHLSGRLADVLSQLYLASATLKRFSEEGEKEEDRVLFERALQQNYVEIETALQNAIENFPNILGRILLKVTILPRGKTAKAPKDSLDHHIAQQLQHHNPTRDRLGVHQHLEATPNCPMGQLEVALHYVEKADKILDKIAEQSGSLPKFVQLQHLATTALAQGWITHSEAQWLKETERLRLQTINVDDFAPDELLFRTSPNNINHVA